MLSMSNILEAAGVAFILKEIHGDGLCHICGRPKAESGSEICSYPHAMYPVTDDGPGGFWAWSPEKPEKK